MFVVCTAFITSACSAGYVKLETETAYQAYSSRACSVDETKLFTRLSDTVGPYQSRRAVETALKTFIHDNSDIWSKQSSDCFMEATIERGVPVYGKSPVRFRAYYEFWIWATPAGEIDRVCVGVNAINPTTDHFGDQAHMKKATYPEGYGNGFARQKRYLPVCMLGLKGTL